MWTLLDPIFSLRPGLADRVRSWSRPWIRTARLIALSLGQRRHPVRRPEKDLGLMFDGLGLGGFNRPGLGQTLAQHRRTDTKLDTEFGAFVAYGSRAGLDAIAGRCSGVHVRPL